MLSVPEWLFSPRKGLAVELPEVLVTLAVCAVFLLFVPRLQNQSHSLTAHWDGGSSLSQSVHGQTFTNAHSTELDWAENCAVHSPHFWWCKKLDSVSYSWVWAGLVGKHGDQCAVWVGRGKKEKIGTRAVRSFVFLCRIYVDVSSSSPQMVIDW